LDAIVGFGLGVLTLVRKDLYITGD